MSRFFKDHVYQAFRTLQFVFVVAPILAGLDKFFYVMTNWSQYIAPFALKILNFHDRGFMMFVGVIEVIAGIGVFLNPKVFSYVVSVWLFVIIVNLLMTGSYFDIALRDLGLFLSSLALGSLSQYYAAK